MPVYTDEQKQRARNVDVADFLKKVEGFTFVRSGKYLKCKDPEQTGQPSSLTVDTNLNRIFYNAETGNRPLSALDWCTVVRKMDFQSAMKLVLDEEPGERTADHSAKTFRTVANQEFTQFRKSTTQPEIKDFQMPEHSQDTQAVRKYLTQQRGIPGYIVDDCIQQGIVYQDVRNNAVFAGFDDQGTMKYAARRGTYIPKSGEPFKRDASGSDKNFAFKMVGKRTDTVYVTEAAIDAISLAAIEDKLHGQGAYREKTYLSTGGAGMDKALEQFCKTHDVRTINVCFDNDEAGRKGMEKLMKKFRAMGYVVNDMRASRAHDYNDELVAFNQNPDFYTEPPDGKHEQQASVNEEGKRQWRNANEDKVFSKQLDSFQAGQMAVHQVIGVCNTPLVLKLLNSTAKKIVISQGDLKNAIENADYSGKKHTNGHEVELDEIRKLSSSLRNPLMILKGGNRNPNSVIIVTEMKNKTGERVIVPISLDRQKGKISKIESIYGKKNLADYLRRNQDKILAVNIEKADILSVDIGYQLSKSILGSIICYDNSIAYTTANVNYPSQELTKNSQIQEQADGREFHETMKDNRNEQERQTEQTIPNEYFPEPTPTEQDVPPIDVIDHLETETSSEMVKSPQTRGSDASTISPAPMQPVQHESPDQRRERLIHNMEVNAETSRKRLLPIMEAKAQGHEHKIAALTDKIHTKEQKIERNTAAITRLSDKADKLSDLSKGLQVAAGDNPLVKSLIHKIEQKTDAIRNEKIPRREHKIAVHQEKMSELQAKRDVSQHKLDRVVSLSSMVQSFGIIKPSKRRQEFASSLDQFKKATIQCMNDKVHQYDVKISGVMEKMDSPKTSASERSNLQKKLDSLKTKRTALTDKLDRKLQDIRDDAFFSTRQPETIDAIQAATAEHIANAAERGEFSVPKVSEAILTEAARTARAMHDLAPVQQDQRQENAAHVEQVDPEFLRSLTADNRAGVTIPVTDAVKIAEKLEQQGVQYGIRKTEKMACIIVGKDDASALQSAMREAKKDKCVEYIHSDFYKETPREERFTQQMNAQDAREAVRQMEQAGIPHSAVIDNVKGKGKVTVRKEDKKTLTGFFSRKKLTKEAEAIKRKPVDKDKQRTEERSSRKKNDQSL